MTLDQLHLTRPNHATIVPEEASVRGMIVKVQGYVTWGEAEADTVSLLVKERAEVEGGTRWSAAPTNGGDAPLKSVTDSVMGNGLVKTPGIKPLFRLHAPKGGWRSTKRPFAHGGALGYRGRTINDLARKMV
ncbi:MAG: 50S ribosomal protein L30, partial [Thermoplasmata archaeon]|nr:50S ribosomal protein L30 [Thermoplasmata archaeon]